MNPKKNYPEVEQLKKFLSIFNQETDRGAVLIAASFLEERLEEILQVFLIDNIVSSELLKGFNAPLGPFSVKIKTCLALGLIEKKEYDEMEIIRKIRNKFAHKWYGISFDSNVIKDYCDNLSWRGPTEFEENSSPRERFNTTVAMLLVDLLWRVRLVEKEKRELRKWPNKTR